MTTKVFRVEFTVPIYDVEAETEEIAIQIAREAFLDLTPRAMLREASIDVTEVRTQ